MKAYDILMVGAGIYGITTALELKARGYHVAVLDPGPLPHPLAASTDISKVVRMEYGADETYMEMVEQAYQGWLQWNEELGETLFHDVGVLMISRTPMSPGGYEYESYHLLRKRGHAPERLTDDAISRRFPAWRPGAFVDGFFHAQGGYAESGRVVAALVRLAQAKGVMLYPDQTVVALIEEGSRIKGARTRDGNIFPAEHVVVASGAWTALLVPDLASILKVTGHPVFHLKPANPALFAPPDFVVFTADIARTGWYGFPLHPRENVVKLAHHGAGQVLHPEQDERLVTGSDVERLRAFLFATLPALYDAPLVYTRRCLYVDTPDGDFWIDRHPQRAGLTVASGDSGHGFKFAPILGGLIADAVEGKPNRWLSKFRWRDVSWHDVRKEAARFQGQI
ncbi:MAG TPA: FAD-dependent oxidoreductase [Ktedonobacteraceae bacterium]|nr:FAD-dependent oxidoreductase [Ktedonobacteraceae bacterium]